MRRREFLKTAGLLAGTSLTNRLALGRSSWIGRSSPEEKPNILLITTDQQSADALSCRMGNTYINTPAMDSLAANGTFFTRAYSANPLCIPARTAMFTGQCPHVTGIQFNDTKASLVGRYRCLGNVFREAGYDTAYFGKWHLPYPVGDRSAHGFEVTAAIKNDGIDSEIPGPAEEFMRQRRDRPFLLVTSFVNPHNICEWPRGEPLKNGPVGAPPSVEHCPPAVLNLLPMEDETDIMKFMRRSYQGNNKFPVGSFDEKKWREYRWAYFRMIEMVDSHIARVLQALRRSGKHENTLIVFTSDHGDCQGAHGWNQKTVFYDESSRIPFIISRGWDTNAKTTDRLVNTGIDLLPTLCDFAGIQIEDRLPGISLRETTVGADGKDARAYVVVENKMVQGVPIDGKKLEPEGRMVRSRQFKYCVYDVGSRNESLVDMDDDPGETRNLAERAEYRQILEQHRKYLAEWCQMTNDHFAVSG